MYLCELLLVVGWLVKEMQGSKILEDGTEGGGGVWPGKRCI